MWSTEQGEKKAGGACAVFGTNFKSLENDRGALALDLAVV